MSQLTPFRSLQFLVRTSVWGAAGLVAIVVAPTPHAQDFGWADLAMISPTSPITSTTAGYVCYNDGVYLACDDNAPYVNFQTGDIGIGTDVPNAKLEVAGTISATGLLVNGTDITAGANAWTVSGSNVFRSSGNVGIGTSSPQGVLDVVDSSDSLIVASFQRLGGNTFWDSKQTLQIRALSGGIALRALSDIYNHVGASNRFVIMNSNNNLLTVLGSGNVGISTTAPNAKLEVAGTISATGLTVSGTANVDALVVNGTAITSGGASSIDGLSDAAKNDTDYNMFLGHTGGSVGAEDDDNIAIGHTALDSLNNSGGDFNIALGRGALTTNTEGDNNIAIGYEALNLATTGANTAVGFRAGYQISGTVANVSAMGAYAAYLNTGASVSAMGYQAAYQNTGAYVSAMGVNAASGNTGADVSAMGYLAAFGNRGFRVSAMGALAARENTGSHLSAMGFGAAFQNTGAHVSAMGMYAARENTGANVSAMGYQAALQNTGASVSAMGVNAAYQNTGASVSAMGVNAAYQNNGSNASVFGYETIRFRNASNTTAIGYQAGRGGDTTRQNILNGTFLGYRAGYGVGEGANNNLYLGYDVGQGTHTGSNNILIGYDIDPSSGTASNELNIGNLVYGNTSVDRVGINVPSPTTTLEVAGTISATAFQGDGSLLTNLPIPEATIPTALVNGTSSITVATNGAVTIDTAGTRRMTIAENGNVGIGTSTSSPSGKLEIGNPSGSDLDVVMKLNAGQAAAQSGILLTHPGITSWLIGKGSGRPTTNGIGFKDEDRGTFPFWIEDGSLSHRIYVKSNGNVGIGTNSPSSTLHVSNALPSVHIGGAIGAADSRLLLTEEGDHGFVLGHDAQFNEFYLATRSSGVDGPHILSIPRYPNGFVGIGISPTTKLEVAGTISATGLTVSGTANVDALVVNGTAITSGGDDLGSHIATQDIDLSGNDLLTVGQITATALSVTTNIDVTGEVSADTIAANVLDLNATEIAHAASCTGREGQLVFAQGVLLICM